MQNSYLKRGKYRTGLRVEKMSKSKEIQRSQSDDIVTRYGADTLRLYEMFLGPLEQSKPWNTNGIEGVLNFYANFWKLSMMMHLTSMCPTEEPTKKQSIKYIKSFTKVERKMNAFRLTLRCQSFMICV